MKFLVLLICIISLRAQAIEFTGTLYEIGSNHTKPVFTLERTEKVEGKKIHGDVVFKDLQGNAAVREKTEEEDGKLKRYELDMVQLGQKGFVEVDPAAKKVRFSWTEDGKTKTDEEDLEPNFAAGPTLVPYLISQWARLLSGEDVDVRFAVLDRKETVGFKIFKIGDERIGNREVVKFKMKPKSFIIASIVNPLYFTMDKKTGELLELVGRTLPKRKDGDKMRDFDADIVYKTAKPLPPI